MTDVISGHGRGSEPSDGPPHDGEQAAQWAPAEPAPRRRRLGLWLGIGAGAVILAAVAASLILIAPGTTVAGTPVGWMTPGMAADAIRTRVTATEVTLTGAGGDARIDGDDLGAEVDAEALADAAFADRPMWKLGSWMQEPVPADVTLDFDTADRALRAAVPVSFVEPTDAQVTFDAEADAYTAVPAVPGSGISVADLTAAFDAAVDAGETAFTFSGDATETEPLMTDDKAAGAVERLNGLLSSIGFYVGEERTVPVPADVAASWLTVQAVDGHFDVAADQAEIQKFVDTLPEAVNREPVTARNIVDSSGTVLKSLTAGAEGRVLGDTSDTASAFAKALAEGEAEYALPVSTTPFESTNLFRRLEVDLRQQRTFAYENEKVVQSWAISSGRADTPTDPGRFRIYAQLRTQDMRGTNADGSKYVTEDVPYISYFNGDEAFHGTYWHSSFGSPMSHGCVNMTVDSARFVYEWATKGTEVWVHG